MDATSLDHFGHTYVPNDLDALLMDRQSTHQVLINPTLDNESIPKWNLKRDTTQQLPSFNNPSTHVKPSSFAIGVKRTRTKRSSIVELENRKKLEFIQAQRELYYNSSSSESQIDDDAINAEFAKRRSVTKGKTDAEILGINAGRQKKKDGNNDLIVLLSKQIKMDNRSSGVRGSEEGLTLNTQQMDAFDTFFKDEVKRNFKEVRRELEYEMQQEGHRSSSATVVGKKGQKHMVMSHFTRERLQNMEDRVINEFVRDNTTDAAHTQVTEVKNTYLMRDQ